VNVSNDRIYEQLTLSRFVRNFLNIGNLGTTTSKYSGRREIKQTLAACNGSAADLVHRFIQLMQLEVPFALSRRRPGSTVCHAWHWTWRWKSSSGRKERNR